MKPARFLTRTYPDAAMLVLRIWFGGVLAIVHGWPKLTDLSAFIEKVGEMGIPMAPFSATFATVAEFFGGLLIVFGLSTRAAGLSIFLALAVAALWVHRDDSFMKQEFALAYAFIGLGLAISGPGHFSLDRCCGERKRREGDKAASPPVSGPGDP